jgi:hypothetical protein
MRHLRHILLALVFLLQTSFALAESVRTCCGDDICPVAQCAAMGCVPAPAPIAPARALTLPAIAAGPAYAPAPVAPLPAPVKEVWTPPD